MEKRKKSEILSEDLRTKMVEKHEQSQGYKYISRHLNVPVSTVHNTVKKFTAHGTVANIPGCGRIRKMYERLQRRIDQRIKLIKNLGQLPNKLKLTCRHRIQQCQLTLSIAI